MVMIALAIEVVAAHEGTDDVRQLCRTYEGVIADILQSAMIRFVNPSMRTSTLATRDVSRDIYAPVSKIW